MADTAHRLTDEKLEEMEKRLSAIYSRSEKKSVAIRNARTMVTGAENKGRQDSYKRADNDGIVDKSHRSTFDLPLYSATLLVDGWTATDDGGYTQTAPCAPQDCGSLSCTVTPIQKRNTRLLRSGTSASSGPPTERSKK